MTHSLEDFIRENIVLLPQGTEQIRKFKDENKWISSNSKMSIPSSGTNQKQLIENKAIPSFYIAKYPVTNLVYYTILNPEMTVDNAIKNKPKVNVSWFEALQFCNQLSRYFNLPDYYNFDQNGKTILINPSSSGFRLPTDAEWQYACKATSKTYQYANIDDIAWHKGNADGQLHNVGEKAPNDWFLYDMLGNIWEWTWDLYDPDIYSSYRIFRGGSFAEEARICGATTRRKGHPDFAIDDLGFRLARSVY